MIFEEMKSEEESTDRKRGNKVDQNGSKLIIELIYMRLHYADIQASYLFQFILFLHQNSNSRMPNSSDQDVNRSNSVSESRDKGRHKPEEANDKDDNEKKCLYIGNIDKRVSQSEFEKLFKSYGQMEYCYIVYQPHSSSDRTVKGSEGKISRGYGFAKYSSVEDCIKAQEKLHGFDLNGRRLNVEFSKRAKPREPTPGRYLGKKRLSPPRRKHYKRSHSRSSSESYDRRRKRHEKKNKKHHSRSRSRSNSGRRRHRSRSHSNSPRR